MTRPCGKWYEQRLKPTLDVVTLSKPSLATEHQSPEVVEDVQEQVNQPNLQQRGGKYVLDGEEVAAFFFFWQYQRY